MDSCTAAKSYNCRPFSLRWRRRVVASSCSSSSPALSWVQRSSKFSNNEIFVFSRRSTDLVRLCKASPSSLTDKIKEDNGAVGTAIQITGQEKTVHVKFALQKACLFGQNFFVVGNDSILGLWDPKNAFPLDWSEGHVWIAELELPIGKSIEFKFILKSSSGKIDWQPGPDRVLHTYETANMIVVSEDWENLEDQKVTEEPLSYVLVNGGVIVNETEETSSEKKVSGTSTYGEGEPPTYEEGQVLVPGMSDSSISSELRVEDSNCEADTLASESQAVDFNQLLQQEQPELPTENLNSEEEIDTSPKESKDSPEESEDTFSEVASEATFLEVASEASEMQPSEEQIYEEPESLRVLKNDIPWGHRALHRFLLKLGIGHFLNDDATS